MNILILGGGTVGSSIARYLSEEKKNHQVVIVDRDPSVVESLASSLDIQFVRGSASSPSVLKEAGVAGTGLCLALTSGNETNLAACSIASTLGAKRTAARVYSDTFYELQDFPYRRSFHIDRLLGIEYLTAMEIARRIRDPGSMMIEYFAQGYTEMQEVVISRESASTGIPLMNLKLPGTVRIGSINRNGRISIATAGDAINPGDSVTFIGEKENVEEVKKRFVTAPPGKRSILIAGGGEIAYNLAKTLQYRNYSVRIMEPDRARADELSENLSKSVLILHGNPLRRSTLENERPDQSDFFIAATSDDENNLICCTEAKSLGAKKTIAVVKHTADYGDLVDKLGVDILVSPHEVLRKQVDGLINTGVKLFTNDCLLGSGIDVLELIVQEGAVITNGPLKNCGIPKQSLIASVVRDTKSYLPNADFVFQPGDIAVALVHKSEEEELLKFFQTPQKHAGFSFLNFKNK